MFVLQKPLAVGNNIIKN